MDDVVDTKLREKTDVTGERRKAWGKSADFR